MPERHVILGGRGFIARHVALRLLEAGQSVTIVARHNTVDLLPEQVRKLCPVIVAELGSADWDDLVADADVVHHYAWSSIPASANANPSGDLRANVDPTISLLDALRRRGGGRVVFSSSGGTVYGKVDRVPVPEEHPLAPINAYGAGKAAGEIFFGLYRSMYDVDCRIARIANAYGAGQDPKRGLGAVTTFLHQALNDQPITIWGGGDTIRDYIHVSDISEFLVSLSQAPRSDSFIFNVGSGFGTSLNDIVSEIERQLGRSPVVQRMEHRSFDVPVSVLSIEKAAAVLGWHPRLSFSQGFALTFADIREGKTCSTLIKG